MKYLFILLALFLNFLPAQAQWTYKYQCDEVNPLTQEKKKVHKKKQIYYGPQTQVRFSYFALASDDSYYQECLEWGNPLPDTTLRLSDNWAKYNQNELYVKIKGETDDLYQTKVLPTYSLLEALPQYDAVWAQKKGQAYRLLGPQGDTILAWLNDTEKSPGTLEFLVPKANADDFYCVLAWTNNQNDSVYLLDYQDFTWPNDWAVPADEDLLPAKQDLEEDDIKIKKVEPLRLHKKLPAFSVQDLDGKTYTNASLKGKVLVFNFWFVACPPCRAEMPELNALKAKYPECIFLAPTFEKATYVQAFLKKQKFDYTILFFDRKWLKTHDITTYPRHLIVDKQGKIRYYSVESGTNSVSTLEEALRQL